MDFLKILKFEFRYQINNVSFWLYFTILGSFAFLLLIENHVDNARNGEYFLNSPIVSATVTVFCCLFWLFISAAVAGNAAARDIETKMFSLTYTTPVGKISYFAGKFLAAFLLNSIILTSVTVGMLAALYLYGVDADILAPFGAAPYLSAYFFLAIPNAFIGTAIQFSLAAFSNRAIGSYLGSMFIFFAAYLPYILGQFLPQVKEFTDWIDPMSFNPILDRLNNKWSPIQKSSRLVVSEGPLLVNRLLWITVAFIILTIALLNSKLAKSTSKTEQKKIQVRNNYPALEWLSLESKLLPTVLPKFGFATYFAQFRAITWNKFLHIAKGPGGVILMVLLATFLGLVLPYNLTAKGVPLLPRTDLVLNFLSDVMSFWVIIVLLITYYAGELVWREREIGLSDITNATPVPDWVLFLSKFAALSLMLLVWIVLLIIAGILAQIGMGASNIDLGLYLKTLLGLQFVDYLLFVLLTLVIHLLVNNKYLSHFIALLAFAYIAFPSALGVDHKLLIYGAFTGWSYTEMRGFSPFLEPWFLFKLYWFSWALLLAVLSRLLFIRGRKENLGARFKQAVRKFSGATAWISVVAVVLILTTGGYIFYKTNILKDYNTASEIEEQKAQYEKLYSQYNKTPQPSITGANLHVEIYPEKKEVDILCSYQLLNKTSMPIDSIFVSTLSKVDITDLEFDRLAVNVLTDEEHDFWIFLLKEPLQPGDSLQLKFGVFYSEGLSNLGADPTVVENGTHFRNYEVLPTIGYQSYRELDDAGSRKKYGLPPRPATSSLHDPSARQRAPFDERISFEAVVGTNFDQIALAPGQLKREWSEGRRRYFHYATRAPIRNEYYFFSATYAIHKSQWKDVFIEIHYDPGYDLNLERMEKSIKTSLEYYSQQFGPYPYGSIRFVSNPGLGVSLHAAPINILAEEGFFLLNPEEDARDFDLVSAIVAHEVAHQWWGNLLNPASVEGSGILSESLAWYSAMGVVEKSYGPENLQVLLNFLREENEIPGTLAALPLLQANDWYQNYRKGPFALYTLNKYVGEEQVNSALRKLFQKHRDGAPPLPTSLDLYHELREVTPDTLKYLLQDLFTENTFWDLKVENATVKELEPGDWQVKINFQTSKLVVDEMGNEKNKRINDWVEIGVWNDSLENGEFNKFLYLQKHYFDSPEQELIIHLPIKPSHIAIDPRQLLIDRERDDNVEELN